MNPYVTTLSPDHQYDLLAAVRGPDCPNTIHNCTCETLKSIVTARVRAILFSYVGGAAINDEPLTETDLLAVARITKKVEIHAVHYVQHLSAAVWASQEHTIWGGRGHALSTTLFVRDVQ